MVLVEGVSRREVARRLGHSRNTVKKAPRNSFPPGYELRAPKPKRVLGAYTGWIDAWLAEDEGRPRKQRHTATRVYKRLCEEHGYAGSYGTVRRYVMRTRRGSGEVFVPLVFSPGEEAQVD
jgi:transposase